MNFKTCNPPVLLTKSVLLQRCADFARMGYYHHVTGVVPCDRAASLARKFRDIYLVHLGKDSRYRRKRAGLGNAHLLLWVQAASSKELVFVLMVTDGDHPAHQLERLRDVRGNGNARLQITGYELVRHTRAQSSKPVWTWQMNSECYQAWRNRVLRVIRTNNDFELRQAWYSLHRVPGFSRIRVQAKRIEQLILSDWRRARNGTFPLGHARIRYVQRLAVKFMPLSALLSANRASAEPFATRASTTTLANEIENQHD